MTPEQQAEFNAIKAGRQPQTQRPQPWLNQDPGEEFPLLDPAQVASNQVKYAANDLQNRLAYRKAFDESSGVDQFMAGVGKGPMQIGKGFKQILGLDDAQDDADISMMEEQHGWPALAGNITGEVAMAAIPATGVAKTIAGVTRGAPAVVQAGSVLGGESLLAGATEGLKAPETGETRFGNATDAAKWTAILGVPFAGMSGAVPKVTAEAQKLIDAGVKLTPGMAGGSGSVRAATEKFMANIPGLGGKVNKMQDTAIEDWNKYLLQKASPTADEVTDIGHEGFKQVQDRFSREYTDIWDSVTPDSFDLSKFDQGFDQARAVVDALPANDINTARRILDRVETDILNFTQTGQTGMIEGLDDVLRELASDASSAGNNLVNDYYGTIRTALRNAVEPDTIKRLAKTDKHYRDFKTVEHAASYVKAQEAGAIINPRGLEDRKSVV